jgi:hypothetical protein
MLQISKLKNFRYKICEFAANLQCCISVLHAANLQCCIPVLHSGASFWQVEKQPRDNV